MELIKSTGRVFYGSEEIARSSPPHQDGKLEFFKLGRYVNDEELSKEYVDRGLVPADIYSLVEYDLKHRDKMGEMKYVGSHWKDTDGKWCFVAFDQWGGGERNVNVHRRGSDWSGIWWFAGLRKSSALEPKILDTQSLDTLTLESAIKICKENGLRVMKEL